MSYKRDIHFAPDIAPFLAVLCVKAIMDKQKPKSMSQLDDWKGNVYLWIEPESSMMVKATDKNLAPLSS